MVTKKALWKQDSEKEFLAETLTAKGFQKKMLRKRMQKSNFCNGLRNRSCKAFQQKTSRINST